MVLPFQDVIDWKRLGFYLVNIVIAKVKKFFFCKIIIFFRASITILESDLSSLIEKLSSVSDDKKLELQQQGTWLYQRYFESIEKITLTTLDIINQRVYPQNSLHYEDWNIPKQMVIIKI